MNHIYRLVWNRALGTVQVASELAHAPRGGAQSTSDTPLPRNRALAMACAAALGLVLSFTPVLAAANCTLIASVTGTAGTAGSAGTNSLNGGKGGDGTNGGDAAAAGSSQALCISTGSQVVGGIGGTAGVGGDGSGTAGGGPGIGGNGGNGGNGGYGIRGTGAFQLGNDGSITGGAGGNGGGGGEGVHGYSGNGGNGGAGGTALSGTGFTLTTTGTITGGAGGMGGHAGFHDPHWGNAGTGGQGGAAINSTGTSNIFNSGSIVGGAGGLGGEGYNGIGLGGTGGAGVTGSGFVFYNAGSIAGGAGGRGGYAFVNGTSGNGGTGGAGILGSNLAITNVGSISGGQAGAAGNSANQKTPGEPGTSGDAVHFTGGSNTLTLLSGSVLNGAVEIDSGSTANIDANAAGLDLTGGTLGSNALIVNGAANVYVNTPTFTISGNISGSGTLTIADTGNAITLGAVNIGALNSNVSTTLDNNVTSNGGGQNFNNAVSITNNVTLSDNQNGNIGFGSTIDGSYDLTISTAGMSTFEGAVGSTAALNNITVTSGGIDLNQSWNISGTATLTSSGEIAEASNAALSANLLSGSSTGSTTLDTNTNAIQQIGSFSANGFSLVNGQNLAVINDSTLDGGAGGVSLSTTGGNISVNQGATVTGANITLSPNGFTDLFGTLSSSGTITSNSLLQVETGSAIVGNLANIGGISFVNSTSIPLAGVISGGGDVTLQSGSNVAFQGVNTYTGATVLNGGNLVLSGSGSIAMSNSVLVGSSSTLDISGTDSGASITTLAGGGNVMLGGQTLTLTSAQDDTYQGIMSGTGSFVLLGGTEIFAGANTYTGGTTIDSGSTLQLGSGGTSGSVVGDITDNGTLVFNRSDALTFAGTIDGNGNLVQQGSGTLILTGADAYASGTTITGGTLQIGNGGTAGSITGDVIDNGTLVFNHSDTVTFSNNLTGSGSLVQQGSGTLTLTGNNAFSGGVQINAGTLTLDSNGALGTGAVSMASGTTVTFATQGLSVANNFSLSSAANFDVANGQTGTITGVISDGSTAGLLQKTDGGTLVLAGANLYSGGTTISGGALSVSSDGNLGAATGAVTLDGGTLQINGNTYTGTNRTINLTSNGGVIDIADATNAFTVSQSISSNGHLDVSGAGTLLLTGNDRFGGGITIDNGSLQIGNGGSSGAITSDIVDNGTLVFNESNGVQYSNAISGNGNLIQQGAGTLILYGSNSSAFTGTTTVANGTLQVGDSPANNATLGGNVIVNTGATLGGFGTIGGNVTVQSGGNVTPGSTTGTLTVNGNFTAAPSSVLNLFLGAPGANFQTFGTGTNMQVNGNLTLNGLTLNVTNVGNLGAGIYNVFIYGGTLNESNGGITLDSTPAGQTVALQNLTASKQINLIDTTGLTMDVWNANGQASATQMGGGSGIWSTTSQMWTDTKGDTPNVAMQPQPGFAVFGGTAGTVTVDDSSSQVIATGMQFFTNGYVLNGDALTLIAQSGSNPATINVGDGTTASASTTATINNVLMGNSGLVKTDYGTLILAGVDTYSGNTAIQQGTLALAGSGSIANTTYVEVDSGAIFDISNTAHGASIPWLQGNGTVSLGTQTLTLTSAGSFDGFIQGIGGLTLTNGTTQLTGSNAYTGTTTIDAGAELDLLNNGSIVDSTVNVLAGGIFSLTLTNTGSSIVSLQGNGYVDTGLPSQTLTLANAADTFNGIIGGYGALAVSSGTETLTGANTYTGLTTINGGTLALSGNGSIAGSYSVTINSGGTLDISATNDGASVTALAGSGNVNLGAQTLTVTNASGQFYGSINGGGNLTVDAGNLLLYGANTYIGSTTINGGAYVTSENAQALTSTTAFQLNGGELDVMSSSLTTSAAMTLGAGTNTIGVAAPYTVQLDGQVSGSGGLALIGLGGGSLILTNGNNSYQGGTTISNQLGGITTLEVKATGALGSGDVTVGASSALDFIGTSGNIVSAGSRTITVDNSGNISFGNDSTLGSVTLNLASSAQGTIGGASIGDAQINNSGEVVVQDANAGHAVLTNVGNGIFGFLGNNDMSSATVVNNAGSTVFVTGIAGDNSALSMGSLSGGGDVLLGTNYDANNNPLPLTLTLGGLNQNDTIGGVIDDSAINSGVSAGDSVTKIGTGTLTLTDTNTYTGVTTVSNGTLQLGNGGTTGSVAGNIEDDATLVFNHSNAVNYGGTLSGSGAIIQQGAGSLTLDGNNSAFSGTTTVANGSLVVGSVIGNGATLGGNVLVDNGATLSGLGTISGDVNVQSGGIVTPGSAFGALTVNGNFTAAQNSVLNESFGAPTANFHTYGSGTSVLVGGDLTLNGVILNVTDAGGMGPGIYNVFSYGGTLSESNGGITLGSTPAGQTLQLQNLANSKQINLIDTSGLMLDIWNANGQATSSQMGGGSGTWSVTSQMWTDANADTPNVVIQPQPGFAVFGGTPGTVTVDNSAGNVSAAGLQFDVGGYTLTGDTLTLVGSNGNAPVIRVGDGSSASASMTAIIDNVITGSDGLVKSDLGTLVLAGNNSYTGGTTISGGTLQIGQGGNTGWIVGNVANNGALVFDRSDAVSFGGVISGSGSLSQSGSGTLTLTSAETYTGSTAVGAGKLALSGNGSIANSSGVSVANGATFDISAATSGASIASLNGNGSVNLGNQTLALTQANGNFSGVISGSGSITLVNGNQVLSGANTYTGVTTIDSSATLTLAGSLASSSSIDHGTLDVAASATGVSIRNLSGDGVVVLGSMLTMGGGSFAGTIAGTGGLVVSGSNTTLAGTNTYSGGTTIDNGTLSVSSDANLGAANGALSLSGGTLNVTGNTFTGTARAITLGSNGGTLDIADSTNTFTLGQSLSGGGALGKSGAGTVVLTGNNSYDGGTTISAGTLQIGNGGTAGAVTGNVANNGTLVFDRSDAVSFEGVISGSGSLTKQGAGTLTLMGANSYAGITIINAGTLQIGNGSTSGSIDGNVNDNAAMVFDRGDAVTFSGAIVGSGSLSQNGTGTLVLDGMSSAFTGTTTVQNGTLEVGDAATPSAFLGGNVVVNGGATLRGHGIIGGNVSNAGTVWAGGSIGTLTVEGNYTQTANGTLEVEATPNGQASLLSVGGTAHLAGSALVLADSGNWLARSSYTIVSAVGGVAGQFASANSNFTFLTPTLSYSAHDVTLTLQRNNINFNTVAQTPNQFAVATSLNALHYGNAIYDALLLSNADTARTALNQISGEIHASVRTAIMDDEQDVRDAVTDHLLDWTQDTGGQTGKMDNGTSVWTAATARSSSHQDDGNASTLDANGSGTLLGVDTPIGDVARVGGLIGSGNLSDSIGALDSSAHTHTRHAGLYASLQTGNFHLMGGAFYGWQSLSTDRNIAFSGVSGATTTRYNANTMQGYLDGSYAFTMGRGTLAPFVNVAAQQLHTDAFSESGSTAALSGLAQDSTQTYGTLGLRGALQIDPEGRVQAHASLGWQHAWDNANATATMQLISGSNAFTVQGVPVARDATAITAGFRFLVTPNLLLDATYNGQFAHRVNDQAAHLSLTYSF
ncbi:autotransporter-associated beta strand repeat-containing protein [Dyella caseinilytica]|uniref:Autotransporter-associated beta strand repeat-containing protein n=1 Tax=Dyella caseinilytica TaxID=1849581 RepID=A0ABX7GV51_9GAMM|nr:autotransporter-associated beta strand repeat-containing protein [Dyella caseinilytica]QRN54291.1 autotransporter-associated beta strand repeat-containing protein [Dyella caseinilytica]GFZ92994.1 hypothetical protein GCM10011408_10860 [Dyella caseinilytica]